MATLVENAVQEELILVLSEEDLGEFLRAHKVDVDKWTGEGKVKTVAKFYAELKAGEAQLVKAVRGDAHIAIRQIRPSGAYVYHCPTDGTALYLREAYVKDKAGTKKDRKREYSVGEKAMPGESHRQAIVRGIREELQIFGDFSVLDASRNVREEESPSFPGLVTQYDERRFNVLLNANQYKPDGYVEDTGDKKIYFVWQPTPTAENPGAAKV